jgi:hypothetical protein
MPDGIDIRFPKARQFVIPLQSAFAVNLQLRLIEARSVCFTNFFYFFNARLKMSQDLLPFLLIKHGHVNLASPAVGRLRHRYRLLRPRFSQETKLTMLPQNEGPCCGPPAAPGAKPTSSRQAPRAQTQPRQNQSSRSWSVARTQSSASDQKSAGRIAARFPRRRGWCRN